MTHLIDYPQAAALPLTVPIMQRLGVDAHGHVLAVDGIIGPKTKGARYLHPYCTPHPLVHTAMLELLAGAQEEGGNNRGPYPEKYMAPSGVAPGAWCAGFVSWCLRQTYGDDTPYIVGARRLVNALRDDHEAVSLHDVQAGDVIAWERESASTPYAGHVGLVAHVSADHLWTIEGNNGPRGRVRVWRYRRDSPHRGATGPLWGIGRYE